MDDQEEPPSDDGDGAKHWIDIARPALGLVQVVLPFWVEDPTSPVTVVTGLALWLLQNDRRFSRANDR
ncbi:hypothetical protein [Nocardia ninae]|uniref:Uncharacterized protein n=1 Tax=Nocardia ninae NBRC 108245 TaxID=1210091 RepID=A0A511MNK1_9NOCA|nr:hypothetical protein [Nocardia ninae]GEM42183.1 hypothetical protein NN4_67020 [Nocardia ninae NBRC 108245]